MQCLTCGALRTLGQRRCSMCGAPLPVGARFLELEDLYLHLRGAVAAGQVTPQQMTDRLMAGLIEEPRGVLWMLGSQSGKWYVMQHGAWQEADPPPPPSAGAAPTASLTAFQSGDGTPQDPRDVARSVVQRQAAPVAERPLKSRGAGKGQRSAQALRDQVVGVGASVSELLQRRARGRFLVLGMLAGALLTFVAAALLAFSVIPNLTQRSTLPDGWLSFNVPGSGYRAEMPPGAAQVPDNPGWLTTPEPWRGVTFTVQYWDDRDLPRGIDGWLREFMPDVQQRSTALPPPARAEVTGSAPLAGSSRLYRGIVFQQGGRTWLAMVAGPAEESLRSPDVDRFFRSVRITR